MNIETKFVPFLKDEELDALDALLDEAKTLPWKWGATELGPQIEAAVEYSDMSPVLVALGCGNNKGKGCMPNLNGDTLRHCPLHPSKAERELIVSAVNALPALLVELRMYRDRHPPNKLRRS